MRPLNKTSTERAMYSILSMRQPTAAPAAFRRGLPWLPRLCNGSTPRQHRGSRRQNNKVAQVKGQAEAVQGARAVGPSALEVAVRAGQVRQQRGAHAAHAGVQQARKGGQLGRAGQPRQVAGQREEAIAGKAAQRARLGAQQAWRIRRGEWVGGPVGLASTPAAGRQVGRREGRQAAAAVRAPALSTP